MPNIIPPGAQTFLNKDEIPQLKSALLELYEASMVDTVEENYLTEYGLDKGVIRPIIFFSNDNLWRAVVRAMAFNVRHTRDAIRKVLELVFGPRVSQVTILDRTIYATIRIEDILTITAANNAGNVGATGIVTEVRMHELVFATGTFIVPDTGAVEFNVRNTFGKFGTIFVDSDGHHVLRDTSVQFINTHPFDFLTEANFRIPQNCSFYFDRHSGASTEEKLRADFYDKKDTGLLKLKDSGFKAEPFLTRNKYMPIRSSVLASNVSKNDLSITVRDGTNFPTNKDSISLINTGTDKLEIITTPGSAGVLHTITGVSGGVITISTPAFTVPAVIGTETAYAIGVPSAGPVSPVQELNVGGTIAGVKGQILSTTKFRDKTRNFEEKVNSDVFTITINRGELTEEIITVIGRGVAGTSNTFNLVLDPADLTSATSLLKFNHVIGESVEVANIFHSSTGAHFPLKISDGKYVTESTVTSTATAVVPGSTVMTIVDTAATFIAANAASSSSAPVDGDEMEITGPETLKAFGERRAIIEFVNSTTIKVSPAFSNPLSIVSCTYKIRKKYKTASVADVRLYLEDTSGFPKQNFSAVIDRGNDNEEVVWITTNDAAKGELTIGNNENGEVQVAKNHDFGVSVEAAQMYVPGCDWEIIETRATGEFTIAYSKECIPDNIIQTFYLHEKIDLDKTDNTDISTFDESYTAIPFASSAAGVALGATSITLDKVEDLDVTLTGLLNPAYPCRTIRIEDTANDEENFATHESTFTRLTQDVYKGKSKIFVSDSSVYSLLDEIVIGNYDSDNTKLSNNEKFTISTVFKSASGTEDYLIIFDAAGFVNEHRTGESVRAAKPVLQLAHATSAAYVVATKIRYLPIYDVTHAHKSNMFAPNEDKIVSLLSSNNDLNTGKNVPKHMVGNLVKITKTADSGTPVGEIRKISKVGGTQGKHKSSKIYVQDSFSAGVGQGDSYQVKTDLQTGDINEVSGSEHTFDSPDVYLNGKRSVFPGAYLYQHLDKDNTTVDQPTKHETELGSKDGAGAFTFDSDDKEAFFQIPGIQSLIPEPLVPLATIELTLDIPLGESIALNELVDDGGAFTSSMVGRVVEIIHTTPNPAGAPDNSSLNYKEKRTITAVGDFGNGASNKLTLSSALPEALIPGDQYRIHGEFHNANGTPVIALKPSDPYMYVDDASLYPTNDQVPFDIEMGESGSKETLSVQSVDSKTGKITFIATVDVDKNHLAGSEVGVVTKKLAVMDVTGFTSQNEPGAMYIDYGFSGITNSIKLEDKKSSGGDRIVGVPDMQFPVVIEGTYASVAGSDIKIFDDNVDFTDFIKPKALIGYTVRIVNSSNFMNNNVTRTIKSVDLIPPFGIELDSELPGNLIVGDTYKIYDSHSLVENTEPGSNLDLVGGVNKDIAWYGAGSKHPARSTGVFEEYVEFSSRSGNVITLTTKRVFKYAHPAGTKILVASGKTSTVGDGSDYRPYLAGDFFSILFNSNVTKFKEMFKAAGINVKSEETEVGP